MNNNARNVAIDINENLEFKDIPTDISMAIEIVENAIGDDDGVTPEFILEVATELHILVKDDESYWDRYLQDKAKCLVDGGHGVYVPQKFIDSYNPEEWGVADEDKAALLDGPDNGDYWQAWEEVMEYAEYTDKDGVKWKLYHNDSLFAYPVEED